MFSAHHVRRSTGSIAAGWSIGSHSIDRDLDMRCILQALLRLRVLPRIANGKAVVITSPGQSRLVQNSVDPHPRATRETASETPDTPCPDCLPECVKEPRPIRGIVPIALCFICPQCWRPGGRRIALVNRASSVRDSCSHVVRRTDAVRPITDAATFDAALEFRSLCHADIIRVKAITVSLRQSSAPGAVLLTAPRR